MSAMEPPHTDQSDDDVMQQLALAVNLYQTRFGRESLVDCLQDLLDTINNLPTGEAS